MQPNASTGATVAWAKTTGYGPYSPRCDWLMLLRKTVFVYYRRLVSEVLESVARRKRRADFSTQFSVQSSCCWSAWSLDLYHDYSSGTAITTGIGATAIASTVIIFYLAGGNYQCHCRNNCVLRAKIIPVGYCCCHRLLDGNHRYDEQGAPVAVATS